MTLHIFLLWWRDVSSRLSNDFILCFLFSWDGKKSTKWMYLWFIFAEHMKWSIGDLNIVENISSIVKEKKTNPRENLQHRIFMTSYCCSGGSLLLFHPSQPLLSLHHPKHTVYSLYIQNSFTILTMDFIEWHLRITKLLIPSEKSQQMREENIKEPELFQN